MLLTPVALRNVIPSAVEQRAGVLVSGEVRDRLNDLWRLALQIAGKRKAAPAVRKLVTAKAANKERTETSAPKPASMIGPLPPIVTLKHLAEWTGYNHGVAKKQAIEMFTGFVADIGRVLKKQNPHSQPWRPGSTNSTGAQGA